MPSFVIFRHSQRSGGVVSITQTSRHACLSRKFLHYLQLATTFIEFAEGAQLCKLILHPLLLSFLLSDQFLFRLDLLQGEQRLC